MISNTMMALLASIPLVLANKRDFSPALPFDPNTSKYCTWWFDNDSAHALPCSQVPDLNGCTLQDFLRWNPSLTPDCGNFLVGHSYCVEASGEPVSTTTTTSATPVKSTTLTTSVIPTTTSSTTTTSKASTSTQPSNGIETPQPTQPGMVGNCNKFHHIFPGNTCDQITSFEHITQEQFARWNPQIGAQCTGLLADANACVGVISDGTPTTPSNGIQTPQPTQPGMVGNCNKFHHVFPGNTCDQITSFEHITQEQFAKWNPQVGAQCTGLWADANACVGVIS